MISGDNAQGKTNFLEALYIMARRVSPRRSKDSDLIGWGGEKAYCGVTVSDGPVSFSWELFLRAGKRKVWRWNGSPEPRKEKTDRIWLVGFFPHDLEIVEGSPQMRRDFIDQAISLIHQAHGRLTDRYTQALACRNALLKERAGKDLVDVYTGQLMETGVKIIQGRYQYLRIFTPCLAEVYTRLSGGKGKIKVEYGWGMSELSRNIEENLRESFHRSWPEERDRGVTLVGPHRHDLVFLINGKEFKSFASQGEKKTLALALKLAEKMVIRSMKHREAIVLLDDMFTELDRHRRQYLLKELLSGGQMIFSTTERIAADEFTGQVNHFLCQGGHLSPDE